MYICIYLFIHNLGLVSGNGVPQEGCVMWLGMSRHLGGSTQGVVLVMLTV